MIINSTGSYYTGSYYVVLCKCGVSPNEYMLMGILPSRKEAKEWINSDEDVSLCSAPHSIRKVKSIFIEI